MADEKRTITGPGAADFIAAQGGEDIPGVSPSKGTSELREDAPLVDARSLVPALEPGVDPPRHERTLYAREDLEKDREEGKG